MIKRKLIQRSRVALALGLLVAILIGIAIFEREKIFPTEDRTWQMMQQRGVWRIGTDPSFPPFDQLDASGQPVGYDIDLARQMAADWGMQVEIVSIGFDSLLDALTSGQDR